MNNVKEYQDIKEYLSEIGVPTLKNEEFYIVKFNPEHAFEAPPITYKHNYFEISFAIGYDARIVVGEEEINHLECNLSFASPHQIITWDLKEIHENSISYMVLFKPSFLSFIKNTYNIFQSFPYLKQYTSPGYQLTEEQQNFFIDLFQKMHAEHELLHDNDALEVIRGYLTVFLFKAKKELASGLDNTFIRERSKQIVFDFENLLVKTKYKRQTVEYYADKLNISAVYLSQCIKSTTGKTIKQVITEYLLVEAKSLLKQSNKSVAEIGYALGFKDSSYFIKFYKRYTGLTPNQFRAKL
ncbi:helix-turn-helix domain-containing protein [Tenacibaculum amylolyticum]|uniref:helix-turn-helix domain-containing protein n=1 Tax=Tenacibaculum amylolyticum TaxID=104269 RepID=UPI0038947B6A